MITKVIDNFTGALTRKDDGDLNSGLAKYNTSWGYDPFSEPGNLTWLEKPSIISATLDWPLTAAKTRFETTSDTVAVYGYGPDQKLVKIQVNDPGNQNPNYDTASVLTGVNLGDASFGSSIEFFGSTEKIYIGHSQNIARVNFDGSGGNSSVASASSVVANVPRPSAQFLGKMYFGNGNNLIEIDSTETVTSYAKLSPGFPSGTYIRDLDVTADGNYLQITVSRLNGPNLIGTSNISPVSSLDSYKFYWNGTDTSYTALNTYGGYSLTANQSFSDFNYTMGYDLGGTALYSEGRKIKTLPTVSSPNFSATFSISNMVGFASPEYVEDDDQTVSSLFMYGQYDDEISPGLFRLFREVHTPTSVLGVTPDVVHVPVCLPVSNLFYTSNGEVYTNNVAGSAKVYFSPIGRVSNSLKGYVYKFNTVPIGQASTLSGVWESQNQIFSKKSKPTAVRLYTKPLIANNQFKIELVGPSGSSVLGGSKTFTVHASSIQAGVDYVWWNPNVAPGHSWGTRITNLGSSNWTAVKLELDFVEGGK